MHAYGVGPPSGHLHRPHSAQIQRHTHKLELGLGQPPHAELAKPLNTLDPAIGWLGNPFALAAIRLDLRGLKLSRHRNGVWILPFIAGLDQCLALAAQRDH